MKISLSWLNLQWMIRVVKNFARLSKVVDYLLMKGVHSGPNRRIVVERQGAFEPLELHVELNPFESRVT